MANPPMNTDTPILAEYTVFPMVNFNKRTQITSYIKEQAPEKK
jgi:hypothetical protein